jgi:hypothetical protein
MSEAWTKEYLKMIDDCEARESRVSPWEAEFLEGISARLARNEGLTSKQIETLENIWDKATARG